MNATVPERAPEEMERNAAEVDVPEGERAAAVGAPSADRPTPCEAVAQQSAPGEPVEADVPGETDADGTSEQEDESAKPDGVDKPALDESNAEEPPMAWHRFLTSFWLWLAALYHAAQAGWMLWGGQYYTAEIRETVYSGLPALRALDWALVAATAAAAVLCILSASALRRRRSAGPRLLRWTYILLLAGQLGFAAGRWLIIGLTPLAVSTLGPLAVYLALLLVNGSYYRRRRGCFAPRG